MQLVKIDNELYVKDDREFKLCSSLEELNDLDLKKYTGLYIDPDCNFHWKR
jgi:hypothetical protein